MYTAVNAPTMRIKVLLSMRQHFPIPRLDQTPRNAAVGREPLTLTIVNEVAPARADLRAGPGRRELKLRPGRASCFVRSGLFCTFNQRPFSGVLSDHSASAATLVDRSVGHGTRWQSNRHRSRLRAPASRVNVSKSREEAMRAADDFAAIRARMEQLQRERIAPRNDYELRGHDEELERMMDWRPAQRVKDELKARIIARNRLG